MTTPENLHPAVKDVLQYFTYEHLPMHLQQISAPICELANWMGYTLPDCPAKTDGLKKLLEAKDYLVRAALTTDDVGRNAGG